MRCDEIKERFIDLLYEEHGASSANHELKAHLEACPNCRKELEELQSARKTLKLWEDEAPLRPLTILRTENIFRPRLRMTWQVVRYGAIAALVLLSILALTNTRITWNNQGFAFSAHLLSGQESSAGYYTKEEVRDVLKRSLDDSESRVYETNSLMIQKALETMEQEQYVYLRLTRSQSNRKQNVN